MCLPAVFVIEQMGQVDRRIPVLEVFRQLILSNKWLTSKMALGSLLYRKEARLP